MNIQVNRGHTGFDLSTVHPDMSRDLRKKYNNRLRFLYCGLYVVHHDCILVTIGQVIIVYVQWGNGLD